MSDRSDKHTFPAGASETSPLIVGVLGISIPVSLAAAAAVTGSVVVLILAVLGMLGVGAATLAFVLMLASEGEESEGGEAHAE
jgi:hypothetical protein